MADIQVQAVKPRDRGVSKEKLYAKVCYYYPQYTLKQARYLPAKHVKLLLDTVREEQAQEMYNLTLIAQAPHSKRQSNVKKLLDHFKQIAGLS